MGANEKLAATFHGAESVVAASTPDTAALASLSSTAHDTVAELCDALDAVVAERDEARAVLDRVRALHYEKPAEFWTNGPWCAEEGEDWPCPTIRAIKAGGR